MKRFDLPFFPLMTRFMRWGSQGALVSALFLGVVALILIPIPARFLDLLLVFNIVLALIVLLRSLSLSEPVKFFAFPTILLFATLFRLALNVSSTRLILLYGDEGTSAAGEVIRSFGSFVVQGDFVVGAILFGIVAVVNFVVIAKGSARVAEVAARFVLDSLPGKQLTIDSEMRAGTITRETAADQRRHLARESQFYGAMDGAMKFVQGDAIAGLVIVAINAVGGISVGLSRGLSFSDAVNTFGILTIGDGLVNIIPSLLMSLCAGVIVTHVTGSGDRGSAGEMFTQVLGESRALGLSAAALILCSVLPGFPFIPFFLIGILLAGLAIGMSAWTKDEERSKLASGAEVPLAKRATPGAEFPLLTIELDSKLLEPTYKTSSESDLQRSYQQLVQQLYEQRGVFFPSLHVRSNTNLQPGQYRILVREQPFSEGQLDPQQHFVALTPFTLGALGIAVIRSGQDPIDFRPGSWITIDSQIRQTLQKMDCTLMSGADYLAASAVGAALQQIEELFGLDEVKGAINQLRDRHRLLVEEVFEGNLLSYVEFTEIIRRLVREHVCVRDLKLLLEGIAEFASTHAAPADRQEWLAEMHSFLRVVLARTILHDAIGGRDSLRVFVLSANTEEEFRAALNLWDQGRTRAPLEPEFEANIRANALKLFNPVFDRGALPVVLLCAGDIRPLVQEFFGRLFENREWLRTLAFQELPSRSQPQSIGML